MKRFFGLNGLMITALIAIFSLTGCKKNDTTVVPEDPATIFDLKINSSFDWKTTKVLTVNVTGLPVPVSVQNTLFVKSEDGKAIYYNNIQEMSQNSSIQVAVPSYLDKVVISYGTISKTIALSGNTVEFNYITE